MSKLRLTGLAVLLFFTASHTLLAQQTIDDLSAVSIYQTGLELYNNQKYGAAQLKFREYLQKGTDHLLRADASYFEALTALELFQDDAEALLQSFLHAYPEHPKSRMVSFQLARFYYRKNSYRDALTWLNRVDQYDLTREEKLEYGFMLGYTNFRLNKNDEAATYFKQVMDANSDYSSAATYYYSYIAYNKGNVDEALQGFLKIKDDAQYKDLVPAYITRIYLEKQQYQKAIDYGSKALLEPKVKNKDDLLLMVGEAHFRQQNYGEAARYFGAYRKEFGGLRDENFYQYSFSLYKNGQYKEALPGFEKLASRNDSLGQNAAFHLGDAYLQTDDKLKARNAFYAASQGSYDKQIQEAALFNYAKLSYENNFQREAINTLQDFLKKYPKSKYAEEATGLLGQMLYNTKNYREAMRIIEEIPSRNKKLNEAYQKISYYYGLEEFQNRRYGNAKTLFQKSLQNPVDQKIRALAYFWLGETFYKLRNYDLAYKEYKNFLFVGESKSTPYHSVGYYGMGYSAFMQEQYSEALTQFNQYIKLEENRNRNDRYFDAVLRAADANYAVKNYQQALEMYDRIIAQNTQDADYAMFQKALTRGLQNRFADKVSILNTLISKYPNSPYQDDAHFEIGNVYLSDGESQKAIAQFEELNRKFPKSPFYRESLLKIGLIHYNQQRDDQAIKMFKEVIEKYTYSDEAREALNQLQNIYVDQGRSKEFFDYLKTLPDVNLTLSYQDSVTYSAAFSHLRRNDCKAGIKSLEDYLSQFPKGYFVINANYYLAECAQKEGLKQKAVQAYDKVIDRSPNQYVESAARQAAQIYTDLQMYEQALARFELLETQSAGRQTTLEALQGQMRSAYKLLKYDKTASVANRIIELPNATDKEKREAKYFLAKSYMEQNRQDMAIGLFKEVYEADNTEIGADALYNYARIQYLKEQYEDARQSIYKLRDNYSNNEYHVAKGFILLADIFVKLGNDFQAKATLQSIIDNYEGDQELINLAKEKLQTIKQREKK